MDELGVPQPAQSSKHARIRASPGHPLIGLGKAVLLADLCVEGCDVLESLLCAQPLEIGCGKVAWERH